MPRGGTTHAASDGDGGVVVRLTGSFAVVRDGVRYPAGVIGGKARTLLKLLTVERGHIVPPDRIVEVLWEGDPPKRPIENVATLVSRLRKALGPDAVKGGRAGYRLGEAPAVRVDVDEASALVAEAERRLATCEPAVAGAAAAQALEILGDGRVLVEEADVRWTVRASAEVAGLVRRARHAVAAAALETAEHARARWFAEAAVAADSFDEVAHRLLMRAQAAAGEPARALRVYERLRDALAAELGADPAPETRALHLEILRERPPGTPGPPGTPRPPGSRQRVRSVPPPGRAAEMARVTEAWAAAVSRRSTVLVVTGEAGIGKSRLIAETVRTARATGGVVMEASCHETERSLFLQPFVDALRPQVTRLAGDVLREVTGGRAAALAALVPEVARVLGPLPGERGIVGDERRRVYDAVAVFLRGLAARAPVVLVLEDLHNAGPATVELVHYLARRVTGARVLIIAALRPEEGGQVLDVLDGVVTRLELGPLPPEAIAQLAAAAGQAGLSELIHRQTRGQTLFVVEMLRGLAAGEPGVPEPVRAAVLARVRRMGGRTERLLRAASALGSSFTPAMLAGMLGLSPQEAAFACERALNAGLLGVSNAEYEFANGVIQEVLFATTPAPTRLVHQLCALAARPLMAMDCDRG